MAPNNPLPIHGNEKTMNMNHLILTNIQSSPYFKVNLYELKTYHEVIDEIYYRVEHLEPWEKGSRKTAGQTGMCGGVRGVGAGGIVSSAYCLLYKLFTLRLTRKQLNGLITHTDSAYIRALGFMYIRYTQPPADLWDWYETYLDDEEELDVKAGGGHVMMMGIMVRQWLTKIEWYSTLFPRIPVPVQKLLQTKLKGYDAERAEGEIQAQPEIPEVEDVEAVEGDINYGEAERISKLRNTDEPEGRSQRTGESYDFAREIEREKDRQRMEKEKGSHETERKSRDVEGRERDRSMRDRDRNGRHSSRSREKDPQQRSRSHDRHRHRGRSDDLKEGSGSHERRERRRSHSRERKDHRDRQERKKAKEHKRSRSQEKIKSKERKDKHKHKHKHRPRSEERGESRSYRDVTPDRRDRVRNGERP